MMDGDVYLRSNLSRIRNDGYAGNGYDILMSHSARTQYILVPSIDPTAACFCELLLKYVFLHAERIILQKMHT